MSAGLRLKKRLLFLLLPVAVVGGLWFAGAFPDLDWLRQQQATLAAFYTSRPVLSAVLYLLVYIALAALCMPVSVPLTLAAGALFGLYWGSLLASCAAVIGATLACAASRYLFRAQAREYFGKRLHAFERGFAQYGTFYLLSLRLVPICPFVVVNLVMGLMTMRLGTFFLVSQLGMLPMTVIYVNAGTQLAAMRSLQDVLSPGLVGSLLLLAAALAVLHLLLRRFKPRTTPGSD